MKLIPNLNWKPMWISHLGCLTGCLRYWKSDISDVWLYGGSGHAFLLNIHEVVCPSGPTAWRKDRYNFCVENVGVRSSSVVGHKTMQDFPAKQKEAWDLVRAAIDIALPTLAWEIDVPEYYILNGYDEQGYYYSGPPRGEQDQGGPRPWQQLGKTEIGVLDVDFPELVQPASDETIVRDALKFALDFSTTPAAWCFPDYHAGLEGFDVWRNALLNNNAHDMGLAYNTAVWAECRAMAVDFLKECQHRLTGPATPLLAEAEIHYAVVADCLKQLSELFPFPQTADSLKDAIKRRQGAELLQAARAAEDQGLKALGLIVATLSTEPNQESKSCD